MSDEPVQTSQPFPPKETLAETPRYLIDGILPTNEIHLIIGPSGVGKTRWLIPMIDDWFHGRPVFDLPSHPQSFGYLVCDRTIDSTAFTIESMGYDPSQFLLKSMMNNNEDLHPDSLDILFPRHIRVLFIEAIAALVPNGKINDYQTVLKFYRALSHLIVKRKNLTIIGSIHTPKAWSGEELINTREKALGSVAWAACGSTILDLSFVDPKDPASTQRRLSIMPRNTPGHAVMLDFDKRGRLVVDENDHAAEFMLDMEFNKLPIGEDIPVAAIFELGTGHKVPKRSMERWVQKKVSDGYLERLRKGFYRRRPPA